MKCSNCGKELTEQFAFCPFCGKTIVNEPVKQLEEITMATVLKQMVDKFGAAIVLNSNRCTSLFMDLAPGLKGEQKLLKVALQVCNIGSFFINCAEPDRKMNIRKAINAMEGMVTEEAQKEIVFSFAYAYGWNDIELKEFFKEEPISTPMVKPEEKREEEKSQENLDAEDDTERLYQEGANCYIAQDYVNAREFYSEAAKRGYAAAQHDLGVMYHFGQGVAQSYLEAYQWYLKAAKQGYAASQNNLGSLFLNGQGVAQNYAEAVYWFREAAEQGFAEAQYSLGIMYFNGQGVAQSYAEAVQWLREAADQGFAAAQRDLGLMYANGQGVSQNFAEAVQWFREAADQDYAEAQHDLGVMYENGWGVPRNINLARQWYEKAARS